MNQLTETNKIYSNINFKHYLKRTETCERHRYFCNHDMIHFMDVARIATIMAQEAQLNVSRDLIYTTALLHDIGRFIEYEDNVSHEIASAKLAKELLEITNFSIAEKEMIISAIKNHRNANGVGFDAVIYKADKVSRPCYSCMVESECRWSRDKKNLEITY